MVANKVSSGEGFVFGYRDCWGFATEFDVEDLGYLELPSFSCYYEDSTYFLRASTLDILEG